MPLLSADFGDGYGAGILSGKSSGLRLWAISAELLPDLSESVLILQLMKKQKQQPIFNISWDFFQTSYCAVINLYLPIREPIGNFSFFHGTASFILRRYGKNFIAAVCRSNNAEQRSKT